MSKFDSVLVANRGEIAVRILRTGKRLGYGTVAVYSDADREALHVREADRAIHLGASPPRDSYLDIEKILAAAANVGGKVAIHPGYGFLSERAAFASAVVNAGHVFLGPDASSIEAMGDKSAAKTRMLEAGVPCVPGYHGDDASDERMLREARAIGYPVMVKASAGGGGRGMRLVTSEGALLESLRAARSEAESAFGNGALLLEKAVVNARHVEIQVFGDTHGNVVHFGERDCSIQRRNQKVVEEAPSPAVSEALRRQMGEVAVKAARAVRYVGAGTVELLLADDGAFYFLEMNTRLQVEHPVTELVYDVDLVEWQLRVAEGERMPLSQDEILARRRGHAIEVRLCAEDAEYRPQTGTVHCFRAPRGDGVRVDTYLEDGTVVSPYYDSMLGKIICYGGHREDARRRLASALAHTTVLGVTANRDFLRAIVLSDRFALGRFSTSFLADEAVPTPSAAPEMRVRDAALAGLALWLSDSRRLRDAHSYAPELCGFSSAELADTPLVLESDARFSVWVRNDPRKRSRFVVRATSSVHSAPIELELFVVAPPAGVQGAASREEIVRYVEAGQERELRFARHDDAVWVDAEGRASAFRDLTYAATRNEDASDGVVRAHAAGRIVRVGVKVGDTVERGQTLVVLESMKMEFELKATRAGTVSALHAKVGDQVAANRALVEVTASTPPESTEQTLRHSAAPTTAQ